jgi:hypothetical protein
MVRFNRFNPFKPISLKAFSHRRPRTVAQGATLTLAAIALALPACSSSPENLSETPTTNYEEEVAESPETLEKAAENPELYLEQPLTINGEVEAVFGSNAYLVREEEYFNYDFGLLVVNPNDEVTLPEVGQTVTVDGELRKFVVTEVETDYGITWNADLAKEIEATYEENYVFVARSVETPLNDDPAAGAAE